MLQFSRAALSFRATQYFIQESLGVIVMRPKSAVPAQGWFAILTHPEVNTFAVWQNDPKAA